MNLTQLKGKFNKTAIALGLVATIASASAYAGRDRAIDIVYYSDATLTVEVGRRSYFCVSGDSMSGIVTPYTDVEVIVEDCNLGLDPPWGPY